jgi:transcription-repair coupling factor (superfamily II helicase)
LGPEQSGQITAIGFELYCQLLKQSISALKGDPVAPRVDVQIRIDFLALNPDEAAEEQLPPAARGERSGWEKGAEKDPRAQAAFCGTDS